MLKKVVVGIAAAVLLAGVALIAGEAKRPKPEGKSRPMQEAKAEQQQAKRQPDLLDQLIKAYSADDKEQVGQIIRKMVQRREQIRERVKEGVARRQGQGWGGGACCARCPMAMAGQMPCGRAGGQMAGMRWGGGQMGGMRWGGGWAAARWA